MSRETRRKNIKLEIKNLCYRSKHKMILDNISFTTAAENIAIVGPNGSGKTTLLKIISGLIAPSSGEVCVNGTNISKISPVEKAKKIALVNQINHVDKRIKLGQYVRLGRLPYEKDESSAKSTEIAVQAMKTTGVEKIADRPFGLLSGGERQRAHIARAICQTPDILILDEPTNHLDPEAKGSILSMLLNSNIKIIASLHDISIASDFAESILVLKDGTLSAFGNSANVITQQIIRDVFNADMLTFQHPADGKSIKYLDVKIN